VLHGFRNPQAVKLVYTAHNLDDKSRAIRGNRGMPLFRPWPRVHAKAPYAVPRPLAHQRFYDNALCKVYTDLL